MMWCGRQALTAISRLIRLGCGVVAAQGAPQKRATHGARFAPYIYYF